MNCEDDTTRINITKAITGLDKEEDIMWLLESSFLQAMNKNMKLGCIKKKRKPNGWKEQDESFIGDRHDAMTRHLIKFNGSRDPRHLAAIACNSMIVWWYLTKEKQND